ncbi:MAG: hypothetical protein K0U93_05280 [Gammaproteobacteria bacterium]|nr:hypothetical protein [Gammaproteobacteria bacterium]
MVKTPVLVVALTAALTACVPATVKEEARAPRVETAAGQASAASTDVSARQLLHQGQLEAAKAAYQRLRSQPGQLPDAVYGLALVHLSEDRLFANVPALRKEFASVQTQYADHEMQPEVREMKRLLDALGAAANTVQSLQGQRDALRKENAQLAERNAALMADLAKKDEALQRVRRSLIKRK